jgi:small subunit ribosomal protein S33
MAVPRQRVLALMQASCRVFNTTYNPDRVRLGSRILHQRLKGPAVASYYPPRIGTIPQLRALYPQNEILDDKEEDWLEHLGVAKSRGKSPPKKKRTAEGELMLARRGRGDADRRRIQEEQEEEVGLACTDCIPLYNTRTCTAYTRPLQLDPCPLALKLVVPRQPDLDVIRQHRRIDLVMLGRAVRRLAVEARHDAPYHSHLLADALHLAAEAHCYPYRHGFEVGNVEGARDAAHELPEAGAGDGAEGGRGCHVEDDARRSAVHDICRVSVGVLSVVVSVLLMLEKQGAMCSS